VLSKDFLRFFLVWNESIIHFGILLKKNGDIVPPFFIFLLLIFNIIININFI